jgi:hypothetical protein
MNRLNRCLSGVALMLWFSAFAFAQVANTWKTATPESQGVASDVLAAALTQARAKNLRVHSLLIARR